MQFVRIRIRNYKGIADMELRDVENALILVGKNNTGKTSILDAIRVAAGEKEVEREAFNEAHQNVEIEVTLEITADDRALLHQAGLVNRYKRYEVWEKEFYHRLPSCREDLLTFTFIANYDGKCRYSDGVRKDNPYIRQVLPKIHVIDSDRELDAFQRDLLLFHDNEMMKQMRSERCIFDASRVCSHCFQCIPKIHQKKTKELDAAEAKKLLEYKLYQSNMGDLVVRINENFQKNGGYEELQYEIGADVDRMFRIEVNTVGSKTGSAAARVRPASRMSRGMRSIYMLSLLETYIEGENRIPSIIVVEYPELFLHPQLQKTASEILYRLSKKNQVMFSTHSPQLLMNFTSPQIRQVVLDEENRPRIRTNVEISRVLDDLGYAAADALNVDFVFIVEGKQDKSRLPLLLEKYYSEVHDNEGNLSRIAIITTNSCTNIRTYANLKYMNQVYLKDQFLMIRDGDGKDAEMLINDLCRYYDEQGRRDVDKLPRVTRRNVKILKYYSFENYFLNPEIMAQLGIVESEEEFYRILWQKWNEYLHRIRSGRSFTRVLGRPLKSIRDLKENMELFKIHMRGHNLYDIFYGKYKKKDKEILRKYIDLAPRDDFADILDTIDGFWYFDSRKKAEE